MMLSGISPFKGHSQYITFQNIDKVNYTFSENEPNFTPEAKDLLQKLFQRDPYERLGSGIEGSGNDFVALKNHPFFEGIEFETLYLKKSPI